MRYLAVILALLAPLTALAQPQSAILEPSRFVEVRSVVEGRIVALPVEEGQTVAAGDLLTAINDSVQAKRVAMAEAMAEARGTVDKSQAALDLAVRVRDRIVEARAGGAAQPWEVEQAEQSVALAEADLDIALEEAARHRAQLALETAMLEEFEIRAPFDAIVLQVFKEVGAIASTEEDVIMEVGDLDPLKATMFVPVELMGDVSPGQSVSARYGSNLAQSVRATVIAVDPRMDPASRTVRVVIEVDNPGHAFRVGTSLSVDLP